MPRCKPCIGSNLKKALLQHDSGLQVILDRIADCPSPDMIEICSRTSGRGKSAYNQFISTCMKGKKIHGFGQAAPAMKECAAEWRKVKEG